MFGIALGTAAGIKIEIYESTVVGCLITLNVMIGMEINTMNDNNQH